MFILKESIMNGTSPIRVMNRMIDVPTFEQAISEIKNIAARTGAELFDELTTDLGWHYKVKQEESGPGKIVFDCHGFMSREAL